MLGRFYKGFVKAKLKWINLLSEKKLTGVTHWMYILPQEVYRVGLKSIFKSTGEKAVNIFFSSKNSFKLVHFRFRKEKPILRVL